MEEEIKIEYLTTEYVTDKEISDQLKEYIDPVELKFHEVNSTLTKYYAEDLLDVRMIVDRYLGININIRVAPLIYCLIHIHSLQFVDQNVDITLSSTVGIGDKLVSDNNINIYPNPTRNIFNI